MKVTKSTLIRIIREEITRSLNEAEPASGAEGGGEQAPTQTTGTTGTQSSEESAEAEDAEEAEAVQTGTTTENWITMSAYPGDAPINIMIIPTVPDSGIPSETLVIHGEPSGAKGKIGDVTIYLADSVESMKTIALKAAKEMQSKAPKPYGIKSLDLDKLGNPDNPEEIVARILDEPARTIIVEPIPEES